VPWHLYSFSFEYGTRFSCTYPRQPEILAYQQYCARKYDLYPHIRFNTEVVEASYDDNRHLWVVKTASGVHEFDVLISGVGQLSRPGWPDIRGMDDFRGHAFHSAEWDHGYGLQDKRIAVIGTGASVIQFVPPVAAEAASLTIFQRSAPYVLPRIQHEYGAVMHWILRHFPGYRGIYRGFLRWLGDASATAFHKQSRMSRFLQWWAEWYLTHRVENPELRRKLTPDYPIGCKRILFSSEYYPALQQDNVKVVTEGIDHISPAGVVTTDGVEHVVDVIIYGTGFQATEFLAPMVIRGRGGRSLSERWSQGAEAYLGITVDGFPNLFLCYGPNTNLGGNSIIYMIECQVEYIRQCVGKLHEKQVQAMEVRAEVLTNYNVSLQRELVDTVWNSCRSWYQTKDGRITNNWPGTNIRYHDETAHPDLDDYILYPRKVTGTA
jgi:cation diffusion facilitator CzcD-associated flavoprotein CzcO